jgi:16S rRNA (adenine1518-N6/adenine1519-N6)-dimethyltransferase
VGARLGQHFLFDPGILRRIADAALLTPGDTVLEIGPGRGTLTRMLAQRAREVVAIEKDRRLAAALAGQFSGGKVRVIEGDALQVAWPRAQVVCGNIPYQITSPLIERALEPPRPSRVVFLVQREVAERLGAAPGTPAYGALSAGVQLVALVERLFTVPRGAFRPSPRVDSALVRIAPRQVSLTSGPEEEARARELIRALFQRRRQQLQRSLREYLRSPRRAGADVRCAARAAGSAPRAHRAPKRDPVEHTMVALEACGIPATARAEQLGPEEFVALARALGDV